MNLYPDDFKGFPIPNTPPASQRQIADRVNRIQEIRDGLASKVTIGWRLSPDVTSRIELPADCALLGLDQARVVWPIEMLDQDQPLGQLSLRGRMGYAGRKPALQVGDEVSVGAAEWLVDYLNQQRGTLREAVSGHLRVPARPEDAAKLQERRNEFERAVVAEIEEANVLQQEVDDLVNALSTPLEVDLGSVAPSD